MNDKIFFIGTIENKGASQEVFNCGGKFLKILPGMNRNVRVTNEGVWKQIKFNPNLIPHRTNTAVKKTAPKVKKVSGKNIITEPSLNQED